VPWGDLFLDFLGQAASTKMDRRPGATKPRLWVIVLWIVFCTLLIIWLTLIG